MEAFMILSSLGEMLLMKKFQPELDVEVISEFQDYIARNQTNLLSKGPKHEIDSHTFYFITRNNMLWCFCIRPKNIFAPMNCGLQYENLQMFHDACREKLGIFTPNDVYHRNKEIHLMAMDAFCGGMLSDESSIASLKRI